MGNCRSCESRTTRTAKLILQDGQLLEFSWPVKVSFLSPENSGCFICLCEEMEVGQYVAAMGGDEVLQPGELYFELPVAWRSQQMQAADMAVLAYKASTALARDHDDDRTVATSCCCGSRKVEPLLLFNEKERPLLVADGGDTDGWRRRRFVAELNAIAEE